MLLEGKNVLITGALTKQSIAFRCAEVAQREGANIVLTSFGRAMSITEKAARKMSPVPDVLELDINNPENVAALTEELRSRWGRVDGAVDAIAFAPQDALGGNFMHTPWSSEEMAFHTSTLALKELAGGGGPRATRGGGIGAADLRNRV